MTCGKPGPAALLVLHGRTLSFRADPATAGEARSHVYRERGAVAIGADGRIAWAGDRRSLPAALRAWPSLDFGRKLILPGFVDAHLHFPQYRMIAAYGRDLLDWLKRYTFPEEMRYADPRLAAKAARAFLDELVHHGITACLAFSTVHPQALDALFGEAKRRRMAVISGKTLMDINAPAGLRDTAARAYRETKALIGRWSGRGRLRYAISPRFAVTSSEAQLEAAGALAREHPGLIVQTHLSENRGEIEFVAKAFPQSKDYTDVYDRHGLLGPRSFFAHGIHLSDRELARLAESGSSIVHCPTSNNFLGSGQFRWRKSREAGVRVGVGCDIGGGTSFSMFATLRDAYQVSQLCGARISAFDAFYAATLGNARLLGLDEEAGSLEAGKFADLVVLDSRATPIMAARDDLNASLHDLLFQLMIMGDDRAVAATFIAGRKVKG